MQTVLLAAAAAVPVAATAAAATRGSLPTIATAAPHAVPAAAALPVAPTANATLSPEILQSLNLNHQTWLAMHAPWLTHLFAGVFLLAAIALVVLLAFQTTKQEGLSGTIGGRAETTYKPRLGFDQQLARLTSIAAITFVVFATLVSLSGI